ncbi:MAG TPA: hypothetical protein VFZ00_11175 [Solirubrobacter sp.]|nr:hypothetical protein [Solirubrobacter sp.]
MTALSNNDRITVESWSSGIVADIPLTAATKIVGGVIVMVVGGTGTALNGADTAGGICMGISTQLVDTALGHTKCPVKRGCFWFNNNGNITAANIGQQCTIVDNQTVGLAADTTNDVIAGEIMDVATINGVSQVHVDMRGSKIGAT